jgi:hypothetical protein
LYLDAFGDLVAKGMKGIDKSSNRKFDSIHIALWEVNVFGALECGIA